MNIGMYTDNWSLGIFMGYEEEYSETMIGWDLVDSLRQGVHGPYIRCTANMYLGVL